MKSKFLPAKQKFHQHWCIDKNLIKDLIHSAELNKQDVVLEIGPGKGILTKQLSKYCSRVIAVEIDHSLENYIALLPQNVELIFANALEIIENRADFNKIISNLPYQVGEPLLHYLCTSKNVSLSVLTVPLKFAKHMQNNPLFSAFLNIEIIKEVSKNCFEPQPKITSALIKITKNKNESDDLFIRRKLYLQKDKKMINGIRDTLIDYYNLKNKSLTKKQALEIINNLQLEDRWLNSIIRVIPVSLYSEISKKIIILTQQ